MGELISRLRELLETEMFGMHKYIFTQEQSTEEEETILLSLNSILCDQSLEGFYHVLSSIYLSFPHSTQPQKTFSWLFSVY